MRAILRPAWRCGVEARKNRKRRKTRRDEKTGHRTQARAQSPGAKTGPIALQDQFELAELMQQFKPDRSGGIELEKNLQTLIDKRTLTATECEKPAATLATDRSDCPAM